MLPEAPYPIFRLTDSPPNVDGVTHLFPSIHDSYKQASSRCSTNNCLRPAILARSYRIGGFRTPDWSSDDILFLATNTHLTEQAYGLNGKGEMGLLIIRPDGYIAYSTVVDTNGDMFEGVENWLASALVKWK